MKNLNKPLNPGGDPIPFEPRKTVTESPQASKSIMPTQKLEELRGRWDTIQASFVDEPRRAVKDADALVMSATKNIMEAWTDQRSQLEKQWSRGNDVSTEDLRLALQQYRSFFSRLLSI